MKVKKKYQKKKVSVETKRSIKAGKVDRTKVCDICGLEKPITEFQEDRRNKDLFKPTCMICFKKIKAGLPAPVDSAIRNIDLSKALPDRVAEAILLKFGSNLESLIVILEEMLNNRTTSQTIKLGIINYLTDRSIGKAVQTQIIEQKVIQVNITKPDLSVIDVGE